MISIKFLTQTRSVAPFLSNFRKFNSASSSFGQVKFESRQNNYGYRVLTSANVPNMFHPEDLSKFLTKPVPLEKSLESLLTSKDWLSCPINDLFAGFEEICMYCRHFDLQICDPKFDDFIDAIADRRNDLSDDQLLDTLKLLLLLPQVPSKHTRNFWDLWLAIEYVCMERIPRWDLGKRLLYVDHFYNLGLGKISRITHNVIMRMGRNIPIMPKDLFLQMLFFLNITRWPIDEMIDIEVNWLRSIENMTIEEVGVVCMGLFKTRTRIKDNRVLKKVFIKLQENLATVDSMTFSNVVKTLEHSTRPQEAYLITELLDALMPHIPRLELICCLQIALLGSDFQQCHEPSLALIIDRFNKEFDKARLKDMERLTFVIGIYDFHTPDGLERKLCERIIADFENRIDEIAFYPRVFILLLSYLSIIDPAYVTKEMLTTVLNPDLLDKTYGKNTIKWGREIICLDSFAEIFYGDAYKGPRMTKQKKNYLVNSSLDYLPDPAKPYKIKHSHRILLEAFESCKEVYEHARMYNALPHFERPDVIVAVDTTTKKAVDVSQNFPQKMSSLHLTADLLLKGVKERKTTKVFAIVAAGQNQIVRGMDKPTGVVKHKMLQLQKCGYETILVNFNHWPMDAELQRRFIREKIEERL